MSFENWLSEPLLKALGWTLLHSVWQLALIGIVFAVVMIFLHRHSANIRYQTALGAMTLMALSSIFTFGHLFSDFSKASPTVSTTVFLQNLQNIDPQTAKIISEGLAKNQSIWNWAFFENYFEQNLPFLITVWFLGVCVLTLRFLGGFAYTQRLRNYRTSPASEIWQEKMRELAYKLRITQPVRLLESAVVRVPMVIGYFRPLILLPLGISELSAKQIETILAHELAHIKRNDYFVNILQSLVEILFFYHPAVWWVSNIVRQERENCCDDIAVSLCGNSLEFAKALTYLEEIQISNPALAMALSGKKGHLFGRVKRLLERPVTQSNVSEGLVAVLLVFFCFVTYGFTFKAEWNTGLEKVKLEQLDNQEITKSKPLVLLEPETKKSNNSEAGFYTFQDSTGKKHNLIIIKDKEGNITELYVDGKKIKSEDFDKYKTLIDKQLAVRTEETNEDLEKEVQEVLAEVRKEKTGKNWLWVDDDNLSDDIVVLQKNALKTALDAEKWREKFKEMKFEFDGTKYKMYSLDSLSKLKKFHFEFDKEGNTFNIVGIEPPDPSDPPQVHAPHAIFFGKKTTVTSTEIGEMLLKDGLIKTPEKYTFSLNKKAMKVNGEKVSEEIANKYRRFWAEKQGKTVEEFFTKNTSFEISVDNSDVSKAQKGNRVVVCLEDNKEMEQEAEEMRREAELMRKEAEQMQKESEKLREESQKAQRKAEEERQKVQKFEKEFIEELRKDGFRTGEGKFEFRLTQEGLFINKQKQSDELFQKYKKLWEKHEGKNFDKTFDTKNKAFIYMND